jgi:hypothetical protein
MSEGAADLISMLQATSVFCGWLLSPTEHKKKKISEVRQTNNFVLHMWCMSSLSWTIDIKIAQFSMSAYILTILKPISLFCCTVHFWVELKARKERCGGQIQSI